MTCIVASGCDERGLSGVVSFRMNGLDGAGWSVKKPVALGSVFKLASTSNSVELHSDDTNKLVKLSNGRWEAVGDGEVQVFAVNESGDAIDSVKLTIVAPEKLQLAPTLDTGEDIDAPDGGLVVLSGASARVKVKLLAGDRVLQHSRVVTPSTNLDVAKVTLIDDILTINAHGIADGALELGVKDFPSIAGKRPLRCVNTSALATVDVALKAFGGTNSKGNRFAIAWLRARTSDSVPIVGVRAGWQAIDAAAVVLGPKPDQTSEFAFIEAPAGQLIGLRAKIAGATFELPVTIPQVDAD